MKHAYNITGMTCNSCVNIIEQALKQTSGVVTVSVQRGAPQATIESDEMIPLTVLQQAIGNSKYSIQPVEKNVQHKPVEVVKDKPSYYPIYLIFGYLGVVPLLTGIANGGIDLMYWMGNFMGGFFLVFSFFKLLNMKGFAEGYATYDIVAAKWPVYGYIYPYIELLLGLAFVTHFAPITVNAVTLVVMSISAVGVVRGLMKRSKFQCACLGTVISLPLSYVTLVEDLVMAGMSVVMLVQMI
jgi:copper chaperone CopZ